MTNAGKYLHPFTDWGFDKWLYVLKHLPELTDRPAKLQERVFARLFEIAELGNLNRAERALYEDSLKVYRDLTNVLDTAKTEGRVEKTLEVVREGFQENLPTAVIARLTGLSEAEVEALRD